MIRIPNELRTPYAIRDYDMEFLEGFIRGHDIKTVVEFGAGKSTVLMDKLGVDILSYETEDEWAKIVRKYLSSEIRKWNGKDVGRIPSVDMVFIDGPAGNAGKVREPCYRATSSSDCTYVVCHDIHRTWEKRWLRRYLYGWPMIDSICIPGKYKISIAVFKRP